MSYALQRQGKCSFKGYFINILLVRKSPAEHLESSFLFAPSAVNELKRACLKISGLLLLSEYGTVILSGPWRPIQINLYSFPFEKGGFLKEGRREMNN